MKVAFMVEVDEKETTYSIQELLDMGLDALTDAYEKTGAYFDIGYNPQLVTSGGNN